MRFHWIWVTLLFGMCGCFATKPIYSHSLPAQNQTVVEPLEAHRMTAEEPFSESKMVSLQKDNQKAGSPSFGLIKGFYQLPTAKPIGAVFLEESDTLWGRYRSLHLRGTEVRPFAIVPLSPQQSDYFAKAMGKLLDAGVHFVEVSMAQAVQLMKKEEELLQHKDIRRWLGASFLPGVDCLVSIQKGYTESGPVYIGRVIRVRDGRLLAWDTEPDAGAYALAPLIMRLVSDGIRRLALEKTK